MHAWAWLSILLSLTSPLPLLSIFCLSIQVIFDGNTVHLFDADENRQMHSVTVVTDKATSATGSSDSTVTSPMPGKIVKVLAAQGSSVKKGDPLLILEAMKMEHTLNAPCDGTVDAVYFGEGELVVDGQTLVDLS